MLAMIGRANALLVRPFTQAVDLEIAVLLLALLLTAAGAWHLVLERVDMTFDDV